MTYSTTIALCEVADIQMGQSPSGNTYNHEGDGLEFHQGVADFGERYPNARVYCTAPKKVAIPGDTLFSVRAPIGRVNRVSRRTAVGRGLAIIRALDNQQSSFIEYVLKSMTREWAKYEGQGAVFGNMRKEDLLKLAISWPEENARRKIAASLSAYDDVIENNTRRIKILEEMAQRIYREWFVSFRFPGHEEMKMVESELGMIPEGWDVRLIGEAIETMGGGTPSTNNPKFWEDGAVTWFVPSDLTKARSMFIFDSDKKTTQEGLERSSARSFPPYSVMMTSRATIGVIAINTKEACTNQGFITCVPNERVSAFHIYFWIQENLEQITSIASGATYKEINRTEFRSLPIIVPDAQNAKGFTELVQPIAKLIENLLAKNVNLRRARDLLLPKLISGEIDVANLDIDTKGLGNG